EARLGSACFQEEGCKNVTESANSKAHWESIYQRKAPDAVSWYQSQAPTSMRLIKAHAPPPAIVIDIGGGASVLIDNLLATGYVDPTVLDLSGAALQASRKRLGASAKSVTWLED